MRSIELEVRTQAGLHARPAAAFVLVLVGLGVDELSADPGSLDGVRAALADVTSAQLGVPAAQALAATDAETVRGAANGLGARG